MFGGYFGEYLKVFGEAFRGKNIEKTIGNKPLKSVNNHQQPFLKGLLIVSFGSVGVFGGILWGL